MGYIGSKPADKALTGADIEDGTVQIADLAATGTKDSTTFLRGDNTFQTIGTNTPAFNAESTGTVSVSSGNTYTKATHITVENFDTDSAYDATNSKFVVPSGGAGKYLIIYGGQLNNSDRPDFILYKNGVGVSQTFIRGDNSGNTGDDNSIRGSVILNLAVADYLEIYARTNTASSTTIANVGFSGMRLIGA